MTGIIYDASADVNHWIAHQLNLPGPIDKAYCIGVCRDGHMLAGIAYSNMRVDRRGIPFAVEMTIASISPRWATRRALAAAFWYPFRELRVRRVQAVTARGNRKARDMLTRLGYKYEGMARDAWPDGGDAALYSMLSTECRWIREYEVSP